MNKQYILWFMTNKAYMTWLKQTQLLSYVTTKDHMNFKTSSFTLNFVTLDRTFISHMVRHVRESPELLLRSLIPPQYITKIDLNGGNKRKPSHRMTFTAGLPGMNYSKAAIDTHTKSKLKAPMKNLHHKTSSLRQTLILAYGTNL